MGIRLEHVSKSFGKIHVLRDLDLEIESGELFSVVGPSGSGKTTLLRIIAGLERQDKGNVWINGRVVDGVPAPQRNVGMVFQDYALYPNKTVLENIISPLLVKGTPRHEAVSLAEEMAGKLGISETLSRRPGQISGGQQQRVALARALIKRPDVFLLDEPLSNLDTQLRFSARRFLRDVQRDFGITTVYITHDQSEALSISDRMAVIHMGVVRQVGTPREIYSSPADEFVASFVGSPPLNVIEIDTKQGLPLPVPIRLDGADGTVRVGIRPEDITVGSGEGEAEVVSVEYLGKETVVYLRTGGIELRALAQGDARLEAGSRVRFGVRQGSVLRLGRVEGAAPQ